MSGGSRDAACAILSPLIILISGEVRGKGPGLRRVPDEMNQKVGHVLRIFDKGPVAAVIEQMELGAVDRLPDQLKEIDAKFIGSSRIIDPPHDQCWRLQTPLPDEVQSFILDLIHPPARARVSG